MFFVILPKSFHSEISNLPRFPRSPPKKIVVQIFEEYRRDFCFQNCLPKKTVVSVFFFFL